jgi:hypothetical protein
MHLYSIITIHHVKDIYHVNILRIVFYHAIYHTWHGMCTVCVFVFVNYIYPFNMRVGESFPGNIFQA